MKEKIEWYREVLELEPGSRIFFPLAKLLAEDGQTDEAVTTLRQGLSKHPDHVEARLMLVELLSRQQAMGAARREMDDLGTLFSSYPGFWQAWSEHLAKNPDMQDASVAMRFFSETLHGRKLDWTAVIEAGLKALLLDGADGAARSPGSLEDRSPAPGKASQPATGGKQAAAPKITGAFVASGASQEDSSAPTRVVSAKLKRPSLKKSAAAPAASQDAKPVDDGAEEAFSLRTRTMADILADQGDFAAAADIYGELAGKASGDEQATLLARSEELRARVGETPPSVPARDDDDDAGLDSAESSRLAELLESLAERLEERSR